MLYLRTLATLLVAIFTQAAWGWGALGHMVVGQIAENNLSPEARQAIHKLLPDLSLADVANWADSVKNTPQWIHTKPWHFVNVPDGEDYATTEHGHDGDVVQGIIQMVKIIKDAKASQAEKADALKFIVHFMGDIHQPLHVGRPEDQGGNTLRVTFEGRRTNLHSLWDTIMIMKFPMDHVQYAAYLEAQSFLPLPYEVSAFPYTQIIFECMNAREAIYDFPDVAPQAAVLDLSYFKKNQNLMNEQLLTGGRRLGILLNSLFSANLL